MQNLIFVDCEATGPCPGLGELTEFGAVAYTSRETFHGVLHEARPRSDNPALSELTGQAFDPAVVCTAFAAWLTTVMQGRTIFVGDNLPFDFQWINYGFHRTLGRNPFGHLGRRIGDFYAGLGGDFSQTQGWKRLRVTLHDHHPVHDALGNVQAFERLLRGW